MQFLQHRVNRLAELAALRPGLGAEIDLRSERRRLQHIVLQHDAWPQENQQLVVGDDLLSFLDGWREKERGLLLFNTKEDGLEETVLAACQARDITHFAFLDTTLPTLVRLAKLGFGAHLTLRLSHMEPAAALTPWLTLAATSRPKFLWVDCFGAQPIGVDELKPLAAHFAPILVSPDLQGDLPLHSLGQFLPLARHCVAICTKQPARWQAHLYQAS